LDDAKLFENKVVADILEAAGGKCNQHMMVTHQQRTARSAAAATGDRSLAKRSTVDNTHVSSIISLAVDPVPAMMANEEENQEASGVAGRRDSSSLENMKRRERVDSESYLDVLNN
jgi:hypothetical protein